MSHLKARKEKECLNCNAIVYGRYCHVCGQENVEPKETFLHLLRHFIEDITHFDGKFFDTLKYLLLRPGFLSYEYMRGRRHSYLNPIRMYVFTSAIFFLVYFSIHKDSEAKHGAETSYYIDDEKDSLREEKERPHKVKSSTKNDTGRYRYKPAAEETTAAVVDTFTSIKQQWEDSIKKIEDPDERKKLERKLKALQTIESVTGGLVKVNTGDKTDTHKTKVATGKKDKPKNFLEKAFGDKEKVNHSIPKVMFITLPLMALMLQLLYRKLKQFYYVNHAIFILHLYVAIYLILLLGYGLDFLEDNTGWGFFSFLSGLISWGVFFYTYKAIRNFYLESRGKTFFKCLALFMLFGVVMGLSFTLVNLLNLLNDH